MMRSDRKATANATVKDSELDTFIDDDEPTSEELIEMVKQAIREVNEGKTRPADEVMREVREMLAADDDSGKTR